MHDQRSFQRVADTRCKMAGHQGAGQSGREAAKSTFCYLICVVINSDYRLPPSLPLSPCFLCRWWQPDMRSRFSTINRHLSTWMNVDICEHGRRRLPAPVVRDTHRHITTCIKLHARIHGAAKKLLSHWKKTCNYCVNCRAPIDKLGM